MYTIKALKAELLRLMKLHYPGQIDREDFHINEEYVGDVCVETGAHTILGHLSQFPECCGIGVVGDFEHPPVHTDFLTLFLKAACTAAYDSDYRQLMLADTDHQMWAAAEAAGFTLTSNFVNKKTGHRIKSYTLTLTGAKRTRTAKAS